MSPRDKKHSGAQVALPRPVERALRQDISAARRMRRLSQGELTQRIGASPSIVRCIEDGYPGAALLPSCAPCRCFAGTGCQVVHSQQGMGFTTTKGGLQLNNRIATVTMGACNLSPRFQAHAASPINLCKPEINSLKLLERLLAKSSNGLNCS